MPNRPKGNKRPWIKTKTSKEKQDARKERAKFYRSKQWRELRKMFLQWHPICTVCSKAATVVDHIKPIRLGGSKTEWNNLQSMCVNCHNKKSGMESNQHSARDFTARGDFGLKNE